MRTLGFDTSTGATAVALRGEDGTAAELRDDPAAGAHPGHATRLLEMARELLDGAGAGWDSIERIAVGLGPGTFTGLRVGIATARGLAQSLAVPLVGVSSLQALAHGGFAGHAVSADGLPPEAILAVIDARRGEVFAAAYEIGDRGVPRELTAALALAPEKLERVIARAEQTRGGAPRRWLALGDGALRFRDQLGRSGIETAPPASAWNLVSAAAICELGMRMVAVADYQEVVPDYRRRPDAELAPARAAGAGGGER